MSAFKGTPGPWFVVAAADGETYITTSSAGINGLVVAQVLGLDGEEDENAHLIAAAPALLEAAMTFLEEHEEHDFEQGSADRGPENGCATCYFISLFKEPVAAALGEQS